MILMLLTVQGDIVQQIATKLNDWVRLYTQHFWSVCANPFKMHMYVPCQARFSWLYMCMAPNSLHSFSWVMYMELVNWLKRLVVR